METMYEIADIGLSILGGPSYGQVFIDHRAVKIWSGPIHADLTSALGLRADINSALDNLRCTWCNRPATRISAFGNLESDPTDITAWCEQDSCYDGAMIEYEHQH